MNLPSPGARRFAAGTLAPLALALAPLGFPATAGAQAPVVCPDGQRPYFGICPGGATPTAPATRAPSPPPRATPAPTRPADRWAPVSWSKCTLVTPDRTRRDGHFRVLLSSTRGSAVVLDLDGSAHGTTQPGSHGACTLAYNQLGGAVSIDGAPAGQTRWVGGRGCNCREAVCAPYLEEQTVEALSVEQGLGNLVAQLRAASEITVTLTNGRTPGRRFTVTTAGLKPLIDQCLATLP